MKCVSVITVNYNQPQATEELLKSIIQLNTYPLLEVIVVDNGSTENRVPVWKNLYPGFRFIRSEKNLGFAGGNNLGIVESVGDYLFLINNDTVITEKLVEKLAAFLNEHADYGVVSPKIHYDKPRTMLQYAGFTKMNFYTGRNKCIGQFETDNGQYDNLDELTYYAHGAAMMLRRSGVNKVGLMPENYFLYYEEMDWCEMFKRAGYKIGLCTDALIYHKESLSTGKNSSLKSYYMSRNRLLFIRRNAGTIQKVVFFLYYTTVVHALYLLHCIKDHQSKQVFLFAKAVLWNLRNSSQVHVIKK
jgi:GT2 family glycosyltransferase